MSDGVVLASGLAELESRLSAAHDAADLEQVLRALQRLGLSKTDLCVHIERCRAHNDATEKSERVDENCLLALDLATGYAATGLRWDAATMAPILLGAVLDREVLEAAFAHAVRPNDLLPPRPYDRLSEELSGRLIDWVDDIIRHDDYQVGPAEIFRAPKSPFTTRPAALLALPDRLALEALAESIKTRLEQVLPGDVLWPRGRARETTNGAIAEYRNRPLEWNSRYVVKADIADFYGTVDHAILGLVTSTHLAMPKKYGQAVESLLSALMTIDRGLPQGIPASDTFASAFLLPVDSRLSGDSVPFIRYSDDYLFPADSLHAARSLLQDLENDLRCIGLALNDDKTTIMRSSTYERGLSEPTKELADLVSRVNASHDAPLEIGEGDPWTTFEFERGDDEGNVLWDVVDPLWGQVYLEDVVLADVIEDLKEAVQQTHVQMHETLLQALVFELESGNAIDKRAEDLGRQCLTILAAAQNRVQLDHLEVLLQWFPKLVPHISLYLRSILHSAPDDVTRFLVQTLEKQPKSDWTTGWLCAAIDRPRPGLSGELKKHLKEVANRRNEGLLARTSAIRALALAGDLDEATCVTSMTTPPPRSDQRWRSRCCSRSLCTLAHSHPSNAPGAGGRTPSMVATDRPSWPISTKRNQPTEFSSMAQRVSFEERVRIEGRPAPSDASRQHLEVADAEAQNLLVATTARALPRQTATVPTGRARRPPGVGRKRESDLPLFCPGLENHCPAHLLELLEGDPPDAGSYRLFGFHWGVTVARSAQLGLPA